MLAQEEPCAYGSRFWQSLSPSRRSAHRCRCKADAHWPTTAIRRSHREWSFDRAIGRIVRTTCWVRAVSLSSDAKLLPPE